MNYSIRLFALSLAICVSVFSGSIARAQSFTPGNLVILRVGDGTTTLSNAAASVSLVEFTTAGALSGLTVNVPSTGASALTLTGTSTTQGILQRSADGTLLTFSGYRKDAGSTNPQSDTAAVTNRVIGFVGVTGASSLNTATAISDGFNGDAIRGAATVDGSSFYMSGAGNSASGGIRFVATPGGPTTSVPINNGNSGNPNVRQVSILGGNLFTSSGASNPGTGLYKVGTGLPTSGPETYTSSITTTAQIQSFLFARLGSGPVWAGSGFDTVFTADGTNLTKFTFDGSSWTATGSISISGVANITGTVSGTNVQIFGVTNQTATGILFTLTDTSGFSGTLAGTPTTLATVGANFAFRGIDFAPTPIPEPGTVLLIGLGGVAALRFVRRRRPLA